MTTGPITFTTKPHAGVGCKRCGCRWAIIGLDNLCIPCYAKVHNLTEDEVRAKLRP
jgi:hypothetical protein